MQKKKTAAVKFNASAYSHSIIAKSKTYEVELPSGFTFTLRRPNVRAFISSGFFPSFLLQKMIAAEQGAGEETAGEEMTTADITKTLEFMGILVRSACVHPRIVDLPQGDGEISFEMLDDADFQFIADWCRGAGGVKGENLESFRQQS